VGNPTEDLRHSTEKEPILPPNMPMMVLVGEYTASSAEIVTGALQYWARAIVVGEKTFGKGSVQTIIPLRRPEKSALRLTTALYYTPAEVTIDHGGIKPDVEVAVDTKDEIKLLEQLHDSYADDPKNRNRQNHGSVTGNPMEEGTVEDLPLKRAVEILSEDAVFENLLVRYHKDPRETQVAATQAPAR
jgi:carboxyl-terminal processing protease